MTALLSMTAPKIHKITISFKGFFDFTQNIVKFQKCTITFLLRKSLTDIFSRKNKLGTEISNVTALFKSPAH
jgi:hypothetical protein